MHCRREIAWKHIVELGISSKVCIVIGIKGKGRIRNSPNTIVPLLRNLIRNRPWLLISKAEIN